MESLDELLGFASSTYTKETVFTEERLLQIRLKQVLGYLTEKAYGRSSPSDDALPQFARKSSLEFYKKAISFFMPNKLYPWNLVTHFGNPT